MPSARDEAHQGRVALRSVDSDYRSTILEKVGEESRTVGQMDLPAIVAEVVKQLRPAEADALTLGEFWPKFMDQYVRANNYKPRGIESKVSHYDVHLEPRFGSRPMNRITEEDIQRLKADLLSDDYEAKSVNNVISTLSKTLKIAVKWKASTGLKRMPCVIEMLPIETIEADFYDFEQYAHLITTAEQRIGDVRTLVMILLGGDAGFRRGEIVACEWEWINWKVNKLHVQCSESRGHLTAPKNRRTRWVPMSDKLVSALNCLQSATGVKTGRVLTRDDGTKCSEQTLRTWLMNAQQFAGLPANGGLHILRHTFCSHLSMRGAHPDQIKKLAGHSSLRVTERYTHLAPSEADRAIALLDAARNTPPTGTPVPAHLRAETGTSLPVGASSARVTLPGFEPGVGFTPSQSQRLPRSTPKNREADQPVVPRRADPPETDALKAWQQLLDGGES